MSDPSQIDPSSYVDALGRGEFGSLTPEQRTASRLWERLAKDTVLFYPASGFDWEPISQFADQCRMFVYCDWKMTLPDLEQAMLQLPHQNPALNCLRCDYAESRPINPYDLFAGDPIDPLRFAAREDFERLRERYDYERNSSCQPWWGRWVPATSVLEGVQRHIEIVFLGAEGVSAYSGLFNAQKQAPQVLCITNCGDGCGGNWTAFYRWNEPLGRVVDFGLRENGIAPEIVVTERDDFDWPWNPEGRGRNRRRR
jgi:hypothetical protein